THPVRAGLRRPERPTAHPGHARYAGVLLSFSRGSRAEPTGIASKRRDVITAGGRLTAVQRLRNCSLEELMNAEGTTHLPPSPEAVLASLGPLVREQVLVEGRSFLIVRPGQSDKLLDHPAVLSAFE